MSSPDVAATFETAFSALVKHLESSVSAQSINIPSHVLDPFRNITQPTEKLCNIGIRSLLRLFDTGTAKRNATKLDAPSFSGLLDIVLHLPYHSLHQEKLLHILCKVLGDKNHERSTFLDTISQIALRSLLRIIAQPSANYRTRWLASLIVGRFHGHGESRKRFMDSPESQELHRQENEYVNRILAFYLVEGFRDNARLDNDWLRKLRDQISTDDLSKAFSSARQTAVGLSTLDVDTDAYDVFDHGLVVAGSELTVIAFQEGLGPQITSFPVLGDDYMSVSKGDDSNSVQIQYKDDTGYMIFRGVRKALTSLSIFLDSEDETTTLTSSVLEFQRLAAQVPATQSPMPLRQSIAMVDISTNASSTHNKTDVRSTTLVAQDPASDRNALLVASSPSFHPSQRAASQKSTSNQTADEDTASETSYLESRADKADLTSKLLAAKLKSRGKERNPNFTQAADVAAERTRYRSRPARISAKEGAGVVKLPLPSLIENPSRSITAQAKSAPSLEAVSNPAPSFHPQPQSVPSQQAVDPSPARHPLPPSSSHVPSQADRKPSTKLTAKTAKAMAKLSSTQPQTSPPKKTPTTTAKQHSQGLQKRKAPTQAKNQKQSLERKGPDEAVYDLSQNEDEESPPVKKRKTIKTARTAKSKKQAPPRKINKATQPTQSAREARLEGSAKSTKLPTIASTRARRTVNRAQTYEESPESEAQDISSHAEKLQKPKSVAILLAKTSEAKAPTGNTIPQANIRNASEDGSEVAENSYPTANNPPASTNDTSFGTELSTVTQLTSVQQSGNITPICKPAQFIDSINAAKSSAKKASATDNPNKPIAENLTKNAQPKDTHEVTAANSPIKTAQAEEKPTSRLNVLPERSVLIHFDRQGPANQGTPLINKETKGRPMPEPVNVNSEQEAATTEEQDNDSMLVEDEDATAPADEDASEYEVSAAQGYDTTEMSVNSSQLPAPVITFASSPIRPLAPLLEEESPVSRLPRTLIDAKASERSSIGLSKILETRFPEAESTILSNRNLLKAKMQPGIVPDAVPDIVIDTVLSIPTLSQQMMPPPQPPSKEKVRINRPEPVRLEPTATEPTRTPPHVLAPPPIAPPSTPGPFYLRLEQDITQRRSYNMEVGINSTVVDQLNSRVDGYSDVSMASDSEQAPEDVVEEHDMELEAVEIDVTPLQSRILDAFWHLAEESISNMQSEQEHIEDQVDGYGAAGRAAVEKMQSSWTQKLLREGRKARDQLIELGSEYEGAAVAGSADWHDKLEIETMNGKLENKRTNLDQVVKTLQRMRLAAAKSREESQENGDAVEVVETEA